MLAVVIAFVAGADRSLLSIRHAAGAWDNRACNPSVSVVLPPRWTSRFLLARLADALLKPAPGDLREGCWKTNPSPDCPIRDFGAFNKAGPLFEKRSARKRTPALSLMKWNFTEPKSSPTAAVDCHPSPRVVPIHQVTIRFLAIGLCFQLHLPMAWAQLETGELTARQRSAERHRSELKALGEGTSQALGNLAAQAPGLDDAVRQYRLDPSKESTIRLLAALARIAAVGSPECERIADYSRRAASISTELAKRSETAVNSLLSIVQSSSRTAGDHRAAYEEGRSALRTLLAEYRARGITNEMRLSNAEQAQVQELLILAGAAEVATRFAENDASATASAKEHLIQLGKRFKSQSENLSSLARCWDVHSSTLRMIAASSSRLADAVATGEQFREELRQGDLIISHAGKANLALIETLSDMPAVSVNELFQPPQEEPLPRETGWFARLVRFVGIE